MVSLRVGATPGHKEALTTLPCATCVHSEIQKLEWFLASSVWVGEERAGSGEAE